MADEAGGLPELHGFAPGRLLNTSLATLWLGTESVVAMPWLCMMFGLQIYSIAKH
jgi:hypothetical protein